jgi:hypothetical protein
MPNIYIATRMKKMPECCKGCEMQSFRNVQFTPVCRPGAVGKEIQLDETKFRTERPAWCPLVEREE